MDNMLTKGSSLATPRIQMPLSQSLLLMSILALAKRQKDLLALHLTSEEMLVTSGSGEQELPQPPSTLANMSFVLPPARSSPTTRSTPVAMSSLSWSSSSQNQMFLELFHPSTTLATSPSLHRVWDMIKMEICLVNLIPGLVLALLPPRAVGLILPQ